MPSSFSLRWTAEDRAAASGYHYASELARAHHILSAAHPDLVVVRVGVWPSWAPNVAQKVREIPDIAHVRRHLQPHVAMPSSLEEVPVAGTPLFGLVELADKVEAGGYVVETPSVEEVLEDASAPGPMLPWWAALGLGTLTGAVAAWGASKVGR